MVACNGAWGSDAGAEPEVGNFEAQDTRADGTILGGVKAADEASRLAGSSKNREDGCGGADI